jgi:acetyl-CoA acyltransferase
VAEAVVVEAVRTPVGKGRAGGALAGVHTVDLLAQVFTGLVERTGIDPGIVDDVLIGCVDQVGEASATPGRMAWLAAGYPEHVPSVTIERKCGSSQQAIHFAAQGIMAGAYDVAIAGGVEVMSRVPMGSNRIGQDPFGEGVPARYPGGLVGQGIAAELVAARWNLGRRMLDDYSARSHELAAAARAAGAFDREILPVTTPAGVVSEDETIRPGTTAAKLGTLAPAFRDAATAQRFPQIDWRITAGNSSQISDGAAAVLLMSRERALALGLAPRARLVTMAVVADDPLLMLTAPIAATAKLLAKAPIGLGEIEHVELNEAFAPVPLAWAAEYPIDPARLNPLGGAIALGHPLGASGARLFTTMLHALEANDQRYGLQLMCEAGGMANATLVERL